SWPTWLSLQLPLLLPIPCPQIDPWIPMKTSPCVEFCPALCPSSCCSNSLCKQ
ncbi:hypothetical protein KSS87_015146, partial [Heliosperma pusillum]